ncbi:MAG: MerR family transcriptional regulator, partial [Anaerorhabdus sp.]
MSKEYLTIGEISKKMNVTVRTLQYYDTEGLLKPSMLSEGGRRLYSSKDIIKLYQILSFKSLGFSLEDIKERVLKMDTP